MASRNITPSFGSRLHQLVDELALTQRQISEYAGVNEASVSRWLTGSVPAIETVETLAKKIGVSFQWLAFGEGTLEPKVESIDGFVNRTRKTVIPRLDLIINHLDSILLEGWLAHADYEAFDKMRGQFGMRRARLMELTRTMEQLAADEVPAIEQKLFGQELSAKGDPLLDLRFRFCRMLALDRDTPDEILFARFQEIMLEASQQSTRTKRVREARDKLAKIQASRKASRTHTK